MYDAIAFLGEANLARNQHLVIFQDNVEIWAADHQSKVNDLEKAVRENQERVAKLEGHLARVQEEIQKVAVAVLLPPTPTKPSFLRGANRPPIMPLFPHSPVPVANPIPGLRMPPRY